ncbi:MAG TPA: GAF domain-containing sensor histidine kinase [Sumerlaeia bacterium]|nr:GAF domain-containing sensor histidine kinase [Sumerlaeia bacterium]
MPKDAAPADSSESKRIINALYRVSHFMSEVTDLKRLLTLIMEESAKVMDSEASSCMLYDEATDELYFEVALGEKGDEVKSVRLKRGQGFGGICLAEGKALVVNDVKSDARHDKRADEKSQLVTRNLIAIPMNFQGKTIGVLEVLNKRNGRSYDGDDAKIMQVLADEAAIALTNARLVEESIQRERLAAIGLAVSGIAHHLKNVLVALKGPLGLLRMALDAEDLNLVTNSLPIMERGTARMEQSIKEMLAYSKNREPELELGSLNGLVAEIVEASRRRGEERSIEVRAELDERIGPSYLDKLRLHDAALNLVANAIEAHPEGAAGACVVARTAAADDGKTFRIEVEDNGPGMPEDVQKRIFQPFFSTKGSKGTGLGLAVAKKVAEENGGTLAVKSVAGEGTTFTLSLPVVESPPEKAEANAEAG